MVVNHPAEVRNAPEKILVLDFPSLIPRSMVSRDLLPSLGFVMNIKMSSLKLLWQWGAGVFNQAGR